MIIANSKIIKYEDSIKPKDINFVVSSFTNILSKKDKIGFIIFEK